MNNKVISVFEHGWLKVGESYDDVTFDFKYFDSLAKYATQNTPCLFYSLYHNRIRFNQYVGVIKIGDLTIQVLPKVDKHEESPQAWQQVLVKMLQVSLQVEAKTTTHAFVDKKHHSVLEAYFDLFLTEVEKLIHHGLVKKYRQQVSNQNSLKGKLLIGHQITKNLVHAERFYVNHTIYDRDNLYNYLLFETLNCITRLQVSDHVHSRAKTILFDFPECSSVKISEKLFEHLRYDRKTERYQTAIELARIILMNYHPDIKGGDNNILAIMFDMNVLWENYVYWLLKKAANKLEPNFSVKPQQKRLFWKHPENGNLRLKPDILLEIGGCGQKIVLDTKWKYRSDTSIEDVRQMYAYGQYFEAQKNFLLYPERLNGELVKLKEGYFYMPGTNKMNMDQRCGLIFIDILANGELNFKIGKNILENIQLQS